MSSNLIRGGQVTLHSYRMLQQVAHALWVYSLLFAVILTLVKSYSRLHPHDLNNTFIYYRAYYHAKYNHSQQPILFHVNIYPRRNLPRVTYNANELLHNAVVQDSVWRTKQICVQSLPFFCLIFIGTFFCMIVAFEISGKILNTDNYLRGSQIVTRRRLNAFIRGNIVWWYLWRYWRRKPYYIGKVLYPDNAENLHTLITGSTGTGKTVLICDLINQIREHGDRAIIYDRTGAFINKFYTPQEDILLNPLDSRSCYWSIFGEVRNKIDFESIAAALIPEQNNNGGDPFFVQAARILFTSVAGKLQQQGCTSNIELIDKLLRIELTDAAYLVKDTPAQAIIDPANPKTALSVMAMLSANLKSLTYLKAQSEAEESTFSIRQWIHNERQKGFLYLTSSADQHEALKPLISTWLDIAINSLLSLEQSNNRKIWVIIDELPSLHYLPSLHTGLAESRQFGGAFVLSLQLMAQLKAIYGIQKAEATSGLCRNRVILSTPDPETATWCSNSLGKIEMQERREQVSFGASDLKDGVSINDMNTVKNIVSPEEIMRLENLTAYISVAGDYPIAKSKFHYQVFPKVADRFISRETTITPSVPTAAEDLANKTIREDTEQTNNNSPDTISTSEIQNQTTVEEDWFS